MRRNFRKRFASTGRDLSAARSVSPTTPSSRSNRFGQWCRQPSSHAERMTRSASSRSVESSSARAARIAGKSRREGRGRGEPSGRPAAVSVFQASSTPTIVADVPTLDRDRLDAIVTAVCDRLEGDWLLIGGAIAALWFEPRRTTEDVDILGVAGKASDRFALFALADSLGIPIESMNSAADFFVQRIPDWQSQMVLFRSGPKGRVFRPTATLFLLLKLGRLDERDLDDCRALITFGETFDRPRVSAALDALPAPADADVAARRLELRELIDR